MRDDQVALLVSQAWVITAVLTDSLIAAIAGGLWLVWYLIQLAKGRQP